MGMLWQDIRFGLRMLRKNPGFAAIAVLTLALGVGANTALFSVVEAVVLRPLPFPDQNRLVLVWGTNRNLELARAIISPPNYFDWKQQSNSFERMCAWRFENVTVTGGQEAEQVIAARTSVDFFSMIGVEPFMGRAFLSGEDQPGHDQETILSYRIWQSFFSGDPAILGKTVALNDKPYVVVGVLPASFNLFGNARQFDFWLPLAFTSSELDRDNGSLFVLAKLKPGVTVKQAQAEMDTISQRLAREYPKSDAMVGAYVALLQSELVFRVGDALKRLLAAVGFVLLIACANVANLLLARAAGRQKEIAVRVTLGASRLRLLVQLLTESVLLGLMGGALGIGIAYGLLRLLPSILPPGLGYGDIPHISLVGINPVVLAYATGISLLSGILFGIAPALHTSFAELNEPLKEGGKSSSGSRRGNRIRNALVICEVALSCLLLAGAGLLFRSFREILHENLGMNTENILTAETSLPAAHYTDSKKIRAFYEALLEKVKHMPGVRSAGAINFVPLSGWSDAADFEIEGRPAPNAEGHYSVEYRVISPDYLGTMGIPIERGRDITAADGEHAPGVVLINQALAERYWSQEDPVGKHLRLEMPPADAPWRPTAKIDWVTIVGVAGNVREWEWGEKKPLLVYIPYLQSPPRLMRLVVHTASDPAGLTPAIREAVGELDHLQPLGEVKTMERLLAEALGGRSLNLSLLEFFAALALILAAVGIYGVISYSVAEGLHDIGIRMVLGALPRDIFRLVVGHGLRLTALGVLFGMLGASGLTRVLGNQLYAVKALDPFTFFGVPVLLLGVAALACYLPARRATRVDPVVALRYE
ncbi:MAG: ABC transporter permease [Candidatus Acidiferrales bacterium]